MDVVRRYLDGAGPQMLEQLIELCEINSGSHHLAGLDETAEVIRDLMVQQGLESELVPIDPLEVVDASGTVEVSPLGRVIRAVRPSDNGVSFLLAAHYDTVFAPDSTFQSCTVTEDTLIGPGAADDKGGIVIMLAVLRALQEADRLDFGFEILLNPDEELGSPGSRRVLREAASRHHYGVIFEPTLPDGGLAGRRKGSGTYHLVVRGRAAHAGRDHAVGRNAVMAAVRLATEIDALTGARPGLTVNVSAIDGGGAVNIVPDRAVVRFNARVADEASQSLVESVVHEAAAGHSVDGIEVSVHGGFGRPPKLVTAEISHMFETAHAEAADLGFELTLEDTGGVCDGNDLAAAGLPNLDNLGPHGGGLHSVDEWVRISSLTERAKLAAGLLARLARDERSLE